MKKLILFLSVLFLSSPVFATEVTDYLVEKYSKESGSKVNIQSLKEHTDSYSQKIGDYCVSSIVYGYGSMKMPKCRRTRITYVCILDNENQPIWGYVIQR